MHRFLESIAVFLFVAAVWSLSGCAGNAALLSAPSPDGKTSEERPLRVAWVQNLVEQGKEDLFRPMQYGIPTVHDGVVYLGNNNKELIAFDADTGVIIWKFSAFGVVESAATVVGENVVFGDGDGYVYCLDRKSGFVRWTYRVQGQVWGHIVSNGELVFIRTNHERLYAITLKDGKWKWMQSRQLPNGFTIRGVASPVLDGDRVLAGYADGYFLAYRASDGAEIFKTLLEKGERFIDIDATPLVEEDRVYVASYGGTFYCLSRDNGAIQWTYRSGSVQRATIVDDFVIATDDRGIVRALEKRTGQEIWKFDLREEDKKRSVAKKPRRKLKAPTNAAMFGEHLLVASSSGYLYALSPDTGKSQWRFWPGFGVTAELVAADNAVYVHSNYGFLYCLKKNYDFR
ncbi:MAG: PQQ-binding-like beta-propeller repeat protein [Candidatus Lernaella stagnicola]|nr:PQQ-binding-like beta-propeller repeat protein [Candidatus Lernaella stagnicola]